MRHLPCVGVRFLSVDAYLAQVSLVALNELGALHKHAARAAARVVDSALVRLQYLHQRADDARRRVELAAVLAFHRGKLAKAVFVGAAQQVFLITSVVHLDVGEEVNHVAKTALRELGACKVFRQDVLQPFVLALNGYQRVVYHHYNLGRVGSRRNFAPSCLLRHEEYVVGRVLVLVLGVGIFVALKLLELLVETVADIFQED